MQSTLYKSKYIFSTYFQNDDTIWSRMYFKDQEYKKALTRVVTSSREIIFKNQTFHLYLNLSLEDALNLKSIKRFVSSEIVSKYPKIRSLSFWIKEWILIKIKNGFIGQKERMCNYFFLKRRPVMWSACILHVAF